MNEVRKSFLKRNLNLYEIATRIYNIPDAEFYKRTNRKLCSGITPKELLEMSREYRSIFGNR